MTYVMSSSLRECPLEQTLNNAKKVASRLGVVRVVDITPLDNIGIPVYSSIRPDACEGSLCVHNGKGAIKNEALVGALMEAIEFRCAEDRDQVVPTFAMTPKEMVTSWKKSGYQFEWLDLSPLRDRVTDPDVEIAAVHLKDLETEEEVAFPAELLFHPMRARGKSTQKVFGTSTNGLSSGNTLKESILHGICEVLERDVRSFNNIAARSTLIDVEQLETDVPKNLADQIIKAGYDIVLRETENIYQIPYFDAYIIEKNLRSPLAISLGSGFHPNQSIAAVRAISEAAQSRLTHIHGGRDDIIDRHKYYSMQRSGLEIEHVEKLASELKTGILSPPLSKSLQSFEKDDIETCIRRIRQKCSDAGLKHVFYKSLPGAEELFVTRVVIPGAEYYKESFQRIGRRLFSYMQQLSEASHV